MKKFLSLVCMITCIFGLTACGSEETYTDYEQRKMDTAIQIATQYVIPSLEKTKLHWRASLSIPLMKWHTWYRKM